MQDTPTVLILDFFVRGLQSYDALQGQLEIPFIHWALYWFFFNGIFMSLSLEMPT